MPAGPPRPRPPGPPGRPLVGHLPEFGRDTLGFVERAAREHGDVVRFRLGGWEAWLVSRPDLVERVLVQGYRDFVKHRFFWRHVGAIFGAGLLTNEGDAWLHQRRLVQPAFHHERVRRYGEVMIDKTTARLATWRDGEVRDIRGEMTSLTFEIVAKVLFDAEVTADVQEIADAFDTGIDEIARRFRRPFRIPDAVPTPGNRRYLRAVARMDALIYRMIDEHRRGAAGGDDLLTTLLEARDESGRPMPERQIRDEVITLLLAGHETTALALTWTWWLLSEHPDADARLAAEAREVLGDRPPEVGDLPRLAWAERVAKESMRLRPPAYSFGREALDPCELDGWRAPAGTTLFVFPWLLHRDPRWFPDPGDFRPERWTAAMEAELPRCAYLPFGAGPRVCIGRGFAMMELGLILATIARDWRLEWEGGPPTPFPSITLRPTGSLSARLRRRA
ncbi:MAG TPA: cytochrome P450 [Gemmatimonadota bacterium]|nr:cytochrome P450 [Gemmatimonadota bacterium]